MRTTIGVYKSLLKYIEIVDAEAVVRGEGPHDKYVDAHFRSGVYLGNGMLNLVLSLMPGKLQTLVELLGYKGDRHVALELLALSGGWSVESTGPAVSIGKCCTLYVLTITLMLIAEEEGVRRTVCDICLLIFHLVLSSFTFDGVDIAMAQKILDWNLRRYPSGVFFPFLYSD